MKLDLNRVEDIVLLLKKAKNALVEKQLYESAHLVRSAIYTLEHTGEPEKETSWVEITEVK